MDDLKTRLQAKADEMRLDPEMPLALAKRARRRRVGNALLASVLVLSLGTAAVLGADLLTDRPGPRPAAPPSGQTLPIWPSAGADADATYLDALQQMVDSGHQPAYLSPQLVAEMFAMEVMQWNQSDIEASVQGDDPVKVVISNPALGATADLPKEVRTTLTLERWRGSEDGIFVVSHAETDALDLRSPTPGMNIFDAETVLFEGTVNVFGPGFEKLTQVVANIEGGFSIGAELDPTPKGDEPPSGGSSTTPSFEGNFRLAVPMPDEAPRSPGMSVFVQRSGGAKLAVTAFRLGPPALIPPLTEPLPPIPAKKLLPLEVESTRNAILLAARAQDWEGLRAQIPARRFTFTFGGETDPIAYWKGFEGEGATVLEILTTLLSLDNPAEQDGSFIWPAAASRDPAAWTDEDIADMKTIYSQRQIDKFREYGSYLGWRVGIEEDGTWIFFVAGD